METPSTFRLRLQFSNGVLSKTQKKDGLKRSWVLIKPHFETISDVVSYILHSFRLFNSCPRGILLSMDDFVLPEFESTSILKDKDIISVKRKDARLLGANKAIEEAKTYIEDELVEKRLLASGVRLLANEEFDKETGGYENETDKDEDEAENVESPAQNVTKGIVSKKRKASSKLPSSKKKRKLQATVNTVLKKHLHDGEHITKPLKKRKQDRSTVLSSPEAPKKCASDLKLESDSESKLDQNKEDTVKAFARIKKVSRSTLRKRTKRHVKKLQREKGEREECDTQQPVKDLTTDTGSVKDTAANIIQQCHEGSDSDEDSDAEGDLVPVVVRPGLIRFTPSGKVKDVQETVEANALDGDSTQNGTLEEHSALKNVLDVKHNQVAKESYCWNGITNKRKGQKWGQEMQTNSTWKESRNGNTHSFSTGNGRKQPTASWKDSRDVNGDCSNTCARNQSTSSWQETGDTNGQSSNTLADKNQHSNDKPVDFDKLVPLIDLPKTGDIIVYRLLELSSSWCPELSSFRVGKIASFEPASNKIILVPVPEYPLNLEKNDDDDDDEQPLGSSAYNEDGSLEIDFPSLSDVRIMKVGESSQLESTKIPVTNGSSTPSTSKDNEVPDIKKVASNVSVDGNQELHVPSPANDKKDVWEEISEAVSAKKAQLMQEDNWNKKETPAKRSWAYRRGSAIGPTMARLRAQNGA